MSAKLKAIKNIENLTVEELSSALKYNGFPEVGDVVHQHKIGGREFLKLKECDVRSWKLNPVKTIHFYSFLSRVVEHPEDLLIEQKTQVVFTNKSNTAVQQPQNGDVLNDGYMLPNGFDESQENYEPAPVLIEANDHSYREMKIKVFHSRNNLQNIKERPLPPVPLSNLQREESNEDLPDYIEIDQQNTSAPVKETEISPPTTSKLVNLPVPPKSFPTNVPLKFPGRVREKTFKDLISDIQKNQFYRNTDRRGARLMLSGLIDGAFLIRPPSKSYFLAVIVVKKGKKIFNIGIEQTPGQISLQVNAIGDAQQTFDSVGKIIDHFSTEPLVILDNESNEKVEVLLKKVLKSVV